MPSRRPRSRVLCSVVSLLLAAPHVSAQSVTARLPVIDVHFHGSAAPSAALTRPDSLNVRYRLVALYPIYIDGWQSADRTRVLPSLNFPCDKGRALITGTRCLETPTDFPDTSWVRAEIKAGRIRALAEIGTQYLGISPTDPRLEPYWSIAEEFDLPVGIHMGLGAPEAVEPSRPPPFNSPEFRAAVGNPMLLEDVLMRHKKMRLYVMHAGWPMLEPMVALMYAHPGVYVDVGVLQRESAVPRVAYDRYLRGLIEAGFGKRIMFGSDFPAGDVAMGIDAIMTFDFLSAEQKADILCGNAMRFLRLPESVCRSESP